MQWHIEHGCLIVCGLDIAIQIFCIPVPEITDSKYVLMYIFRSLICALLFSGYRDIRCRFNKILHKPCRDSLRLLESESVHISGLLVPLSPRHELVIHFLIVEINLASNYIIILGIFLVRLVIILALKSAHTLLEFFLLPVYSRKMLPVPLELGIL